MAVRKLLVALAGVGLLSLGGGASQPARSSDPWLELPQANEKVAVDSTVALDQAPASIQRLVLRIPAGGTRINYGSIHTKVNTESADVAMKSTNGIDGFILDVDLNGAGGFPMQPGRNSVELEYKDEFGRQKYYNFLLDFSGAGSTLAGRGFETIPTKQAPEKRAGRLFAVVIGISHCAKGVTSRSTTCSTRTATLKRCSTFLRLPRVAESPNRDALLLLNGDATTESVRHALFNFLTKPQEQDTVVIYIAGHGAPDPLDPRNLYFMTADSKPDDMGATAFPMFRNFGMVPGRVLKAKRVITFTDTPHSCGLAEPGQAPAQRRTNNLINQYLQRYASKGQRAVITASDISESSFEDAKWGDGHGVFTYFLLQGLEGKADANHDGVVTAGELFAYLKQSVPQATGGKQNPRAMVGISSGLTVSTFGRTHARLEIPPAPRSR